MEKKINKLFRLFKLFKDCDDNAIAGHSRLLSSNRHNQCARNDVKTNRKHATAFKFCRLGFLPQQHLLSPSLRARMPKSEALTVANDPQSHYRGMFSITDAVKSNKQRLAAFTLAEGATRVAMPNWQRLVAFTLAEVLITLGIIGIVAAMTLPSLVQNFKKQKVENQLKVNISILNQAFMRAQADYGDVNDWDTSVPILETYLFPYINIAKKSSEERAKIFYPSGEIEQYYGFKSFVLQNGTKIYYAQQIIDNVIGSFWIVVNKNKYTDGNYVHGKDIFRFNLERNKWIPRVTSLGHYIGSEVHWYPKCGDARLTNGCKNKASADSITGDSGIGNQWCSMLIECNGWKIPDSYPIRF